MVRLGRQFPGKSKERQASQRRGQFEIPISPFFSVTLCRANWAVSIHRKRKNAVGYLNEIPLTPAQYLGSSSQKNCVQHFLEVSPASKSCFFVNLHLSIAPLFGRGREILLCIHYAVHTHTQCILSLPSEAFRRPQCTQESNGGRRGEVTASPRLSSNCFWSPFNAAETTPPLLAPLAWPGPLFAAVAAFGSDRNRPPSSPPLLSLFCGRGGPSRLH